MSSASGRPLLDPCQWRCLVGSYAISKATGSAMSPESQRVTLLMERQAEWHRIFKVGEIYGPYGDMAPVQQQKEWAPGTDHSWARSGGCACAGARRPRAFLGLAAEQVLGGQLGARRVRQRQLWPAGGTFRCGLPRQSLRGVGYVMGACEDLSNKITAMTCAARSER